MSPTRREFLASAAATVMSTSPAISALKAADRKLAEQRRKIRAALKGDPQSDDERRRLDAERKRAVRATDKDVLIPDLPAKNRRRRLRYEKDDAAWLRYYFGPKSNVADPFTYKFTSQQTEMIAAIRHAIRYGGDQSIAASRGEGKTTLAERLLVKYTLEGRVSFSVLCAATGSAAGNSLESIRDAIENNDLLAEDYPETCIPVRALENTPNRAHYQTVTGHRFDTGEAFERVPSRFSWCGQEVVLPSVPGSPSNGAIIATRGLDAAVRGLKRRGKRPDVVIIDDPDTEETARSEDQAKKLEARIDNALGALGGQKKNVARVMLTTLQNRIAVSYRYTDPTQKASWKGKRFRYLVEPPARVDLWDEYVQLRGACQQVVDEGGESTDPFARGAHKFFLAHRKEMEAGAVVANPNRFNGEKLPDGSRYEMSALQHYYNEMADKSPEFCQCELDNDPPEETGPVESGLTSHIILQHMSGYERLVVPPGCEIVTQGIDVGKYALHYVVRAWKPDGTGYVIDKGVQDVAGTTLGRDIGVEHAIVQALRSRMEIANSGIYHQIDDESVPVSLTLIDAGYKSEAVYAFCREAGLACMPAMGIGKSAGCVKVRFTGVQKISDTRRPGDHWFMSRENRRDWLVDMDADHWKSWEHARWMTATDQPGTMFLYGAASDNVKRRGRYEIEHFNYAKHIVAEIEVEEPIKGVLVRRWRAKSEANHFLDASYMSNVAANMRGISLLKRPAKRGTAGGRMSLAELAGGRR